MTADQDCSLSILFSADGVSWNHSYDYQVPALSGFHKAVLPMGQYMHLEVTNQGDASLNLFNLETYKRVETGHRHLEANQDAVSAIVTNEFATDAQLTNVITELVQLNQLDSSLFTLMEGIVDENAMQVDVLTMPSIYHGTDSIKVYGFHADSSTDKSIATDVNGNLLVSIVNSRFEYSN